MRRLLKALEGTQLSEDAPPSHPVSVCASLFQPQESFHISSKPRNMGTCPIRCQSNRTILENSAEPVTSGRFVPKSSTCKRKNKKNRTWFIVFVCFFLSAANEDSIIVSLCDYPSFGRTELTMCIGEQLTVLSEYVTLLSNVSPSPSFSLKEIQLVMTACFLQQ